MTLLIVYKLLSMCTLLLIPSDRLRLPGKLVNIRAVGSMLTLISIRLVGRCRLPLSSIVLIPLALVTEVVLLLARNIMLPVMRWV